MIYTFLGDNFNIYVLFFFKVFLEFKENSLCPLSQAKTMTVT
jgi:hypothetical protein